MLSPLLHHHYSPTCCIYYCSSLTFHCWLLPCWSMGDHCLSPRVSLHNFTNLLELVWLIERNRHSRIPCAIANRNLSVYQKRLILSLPRSGNFWVESKLTPPEDTVTSAIDRIYPTRAVQKALVTTANHISQRYGIVLFGRLLPPVLCYLIASSPETPTS